MQTFSTRPSYRPLLVLLTLGIVILGALAAGAAFISLLPSDIGRQYGAVLSIVKAIRADLFAKTAAIYAVMVVLIIAAVVLLHLFYSHRIAGPAYRLGKEAATIGRGELKGNIRFRRKDNLTDLADALNQAVAQYRSRIITAKERLALLEAELDSLSGMIQKGEDGPKRERNTEEIVQTVKSIERIFEEIRA